MSTAQAQKLELLEWLATLSDEQVLAELVKWKEDHQRVSIERYNQELEEANQRIESGNYIAHEDLIKESESWMK
jgi:hypothetical protein